MRDRDPPADFVEFVVRCAARLSAATRTLTGDDAAATDLSIRLLGDAARRWRTLRPPPDDPGRYVAAQAHVGQLFRRRAAR
ncbi:MAG TPA: hypothetical protein VES42_00705, partial [Pilimelia sp.]|nr:hypothetical protein [Pilimelia sp.]